MKKILFMIAIVFGLVFSVNADARYGRIGGFRSSGFRSHSYSRSHSSPSKVHSASHTAKSQAVKNASAKTESVASKAKNTSSKVAETKSNVTDSVASTKKIYNKTVVNKTSDGFNAPLWFLIGHSSAHDRVTVINNTDEKFSCEDCKSVKDENEVYTACMKKCVK